MKCHLGIWMDIRKKWKILSCLAGPPSLWPLPNILYSELGVRINTSIRMQADKLLRVKLNTLTAPAEGGTEKTKAGKTSAGPARPRGWQHEYEGKTWPGLAGTGSWHAFIQKTRSQNQKARITHGHSPLIIWSYCLLFHFAYGIFVSFSKSDI